MAAGTGLVLLALNGLQLMAPLQCQPPEPEFFVCGILLCAFWVGWVVFFVSLNCWINSKISP